ncbi:YbhB/YbcL family Raf kinase inhibitor-like protein [Methylosinus sp. Sm6]|uniref:YbhB/YbcL family Raf kinase inhibitor-like protein n=1 Tax=Methylosinus sp. Sm6 TaxID=2866948 RepID=UPI001C9A1F09|nr:YbhB/YbcL family Raf kinase inhibitor-like protein [Methylosinus sp. Sm6]MBY6243562.1 YbhB/YbcL family Raf kinase inhibitor-like protein [Methylosinus sp. Sm6]
MRLRSPAFAEQAEIPKKFTCDGENVSPALEWEGAPAQTKSFVLLCDDPDAPAGIWRHWAVYDLSPRNSGLPEGAGRPGPGRGYSQAINDFDRSGYGGPCPPPRHGVHHYRFRLLALSVPALRVPRADPTCEEVEQAAKSAALAEALLIGTYQR